MEQLVKDEVYKEYTKENTSYPLGLYPSCRSSLYVAKKKGRDAVSTKVLDSLIPRAPSKNKAGYTAAQVTCWWAGAVIN